MSCTIVCLKKDADREAFLARAAQAGFVLEPIPGLDRHFVAHGIAAQDFPLARDVAVEAVDDGDDEVFPDMQAITIPASLTGASWPLARIIRRDPPWNTRRLRHPITTFFRAERNGLGVDVYSLDTGIRLAHTEFGGRATNVYEYYSSGGLGDDEGHGTSVASAAVGATVGVARSALVWSFKAMTTTGVLEGSGTGTNLSLITSLGQALLHYQGRVTTGRPAVMNLSLGGFGSSVSSAISDIINAGMVICCSAGNLRQNLDATDRFPTESDGDLIVVGGIAMGDVPYYQGNGGTNFGSSVSILAPAQRCYLANFNGNSSFGLVTGTSFAAPYTAGVVACMLEGRPRLNGRAQVQSIKAALLRNATRGRFVRQPQFGIGYLPDRILYLDPDA